MSPRNTFTVADSNESQPACILSHLGNSAVSLRCGICPERSGTRHQHRSITDTVTKVTYKKTGFPSPAQLNPTDRLVLLHRYKAEGRSFPPLFSLPQSLHKAPRHKFSTTLIRSSWTQIRYWIPTDTPQISVLKHKYFKHWCLLWIHGAHEF